MNKIKNMKEAVACIKEDLFQMKVDIFKKVSEDISCERKRKRVLQRRILRFYAFRKEEVIATLIALCVVATIITFEQKRKEFQRRCPCFYAFQKRARIATLIAVAATIFLCQDVSAAEVPKEQKNVQAAISPTNQYGETAEEEAERKALESAQKKMVVKNDQKKAEQKIMLKRQESKLKKLSKKENAQQKKLVKTKEERKKVLGCFQSSVFSVALTPVSDFIKSAYQTGVLEQKDVLSDIRSEKASTENNIKALKKEPKNIVFNPQDVTEKSNISIEEMTHILKNTGLEKLAVSFVECEQEYGVNAIFLASIAALESDWGRSRRAVEDNNYTGLGVYSETAEGLNAKTPEDNICMTAKRLSEHYLKEDGMFYNGLSVFGVNTKYCVGCTWGMKVTNIGYRLMEKVRTEVSSVVK